MDISISIIKNIGIIILLLVSVSALIMLLFFIKNFIKSVLILNKVEDIVLDFHNKTNEETYIWFEHLNETGIGKLFNRGTKENPELYVICIFSKTNAIQTLPLEKIEQYLPLKLSTFNNDQEELILKYNKSKNNE